MGKSQTSKSPRKKAKPKKQFKPATCPLCGTTCKSPAGLAAHYRGHHPDQMWPTKQGENLPPGMAQGLDPTKPAPISKPKVTTFPSGKRRGRPPIFCNCLDFEAAGELYFETCDEEERPYTLPGLALAMGFSDRGSFNSYGKSSPAAKDFLNVIKRFKMRLEAQANERLYTGKGSTIGTIFGLKVHHGYVETTHVSLLNSGQPGLIANFGGEKQLPQGDGDGDDVIDLESGDCESIEG